MSTTSRSSFAGSMSDKLRQAITRPSLARAIGAHNPLSAILGGEAGFDAIWASGLEISASAGVPDANILSMSECLGVAASIVDSVGIPVLADCDSGFGNVNNVVHMIKSYERRGIAGVCIEDKQYPKLNSFLPGNQDLAPVDDCAAKIYAAAQTRRDLVVVARLEALISGDGLDEAIKRAYIYEESGADALLIHSKLAVPEEVFAFREQYHGALPVIVVPTTYNSVTAPELESRGFGMAIYANHALRSSIEGMRGTLQRIIEDGTSQNVEGEIATVAEVFRLQGVADMLTEQDRYEEAGRAAAGVPAL
jgi:phosphoenolpyruvate phosphomutase